MLMIILFFIALLGLIVLFGYKYRQIASGVVHVDTTEGAADWTRPDIRVIRTLTKEQSRIYIHRLALLCLKLWIKSAYFIRKIDKAIRERLMRFLHRNAKRMNEDGTRQASSFLRHISDRGTEGSGEDERK